MNLTEVPVRIRVRPNSHRAGIMAVPEIASLKGRVVVIQAGEGDTMNGTYRIPSREEL